MLILGRGRPHRWRPFAGREDGGTTVLTTASSSRAALPPARLVLAAAGVLLTAMVALAGPAAAIEDPRRPTAEVVAGPSCGPGLVRIAVTNGTAVHQVALVFDGSGEQDSALLAAGGQATLVSEDLDWGRTVDVSLAVTDAQGVAEDPIEFGTYTRPSAEDCAAISPTTAEASPGPSTVATTTTPGTTAPTTGSADPTSTRRPTTPTPSVPSTPATSTPPPRPSTPGPTSSAPVPVPGDEQPSGSAGGASAASVPPGGVLTVRATGFTPGEPVTVSLLGSAGPLTTVTAEQDGSVEAVVQIPRGAALGAATVQLVGVRSSATAGLDLQVAARLQPVAQQTGSLPVSATGVGLMTAAGLLGLMAARRSRADHDPTSR
jgi:hypothetical protein